MMMKSTLIAAAVFCTSVFGQGVSAQLENLANNLEITSSRNGKKPVLAMDEYEKLILAFKDATFTAKDFYRFDYKAAPVKAFNDAKRKYKLPRATFLEKTIADASPAVRAKSVELLSDGLFGSSKTGRELATSLMANEKDAGVRAALIRTFANDGGRNPDIGKFLMGCLSDPDPVLRDCAVVFCCSSWNARLEGFTAKLADMIVNEPDAKTREDVCRRAGVMGTDDLIPAYEKALADADPKIAQAAFAGVLSTWWSFPLYETANAGGYRLTLGHLAGLKADKSLPTGYFAPLSSLGQKSSMKRTVDAWNAKSSGFYKPEEVRAALMPIAESTTVNFMVRNSACKALFAHGMSKDDLTALLEKARAAGLREFDAKSLADTIGRLK